MRGFKTKSQAGSPEPQLHDLKLQTLGRSWRSKLPGISIIRQQSTATTSNTTKAETRLQTLNPQVNPKPETLTPKNKQ